MRRWVLGSILVLSALVFVPLNHGKENPLDAGELYDVGMEFYYQGKYAEAIDTFSTLIQSFPKSKSVPYSVYMMGQCYFRMGELEKALQQFELYVVAYPDGDRKTDAAKGIQAAKEMMKEKASSSISPPPSPAPSPPPVKKVKRRICAQVFYFNAETLGEMEKRMRELKKAGVDTLILKVFQTKGDRIYRFANPQHGEGVYFKTPYAPVVDDILGKVAEVAHRNELDVFAWMTTRYADYGLDGRPDLRCIRYDFEKKKMEASRGLTLFHPEALKRLQGLYRDLGHYPIDGILFQDDLILKHNEDFSPEAAKAFLKETGHTPHPDLFYVEPYRADSGKYYVKAYTDRFWSWANWKNRWLMDVAQQLMASARESNPNLQFGINLYYEAVLNHSNGVAWFSQNLSESLKKDFDYYAIMTYHRQTMRELNMEEKKAMRLMAEVAQKAVQSVLDPSQVMMKVQTLDWKTYEPLPMKEMDELLTGILDHGKVSLAFVPYFEQFPFQLLKANWDGYDKTNR